MFTLSLIIMISIMMSFTSTYMISIMVTIMILEIMMMLSPFTKMTPLNYDFLTIDPYNFFLIMLTLFIWLMMNFSMNMNLYTNKFNLYHLTSNILMTTIILTFMVNKTLLFFISFEMTLIPIFFMIISWGYQPERFKASIWMLIYTMTASMPLLLLILFLDPEVSFMPSIMLNKNYFKMDLLLLKQIMFLMWTTAFLVKLPMYFIHMWLPKAHVEAPVAGSMVLAAILLKLGGYGLIRLSPMITQNISMLNIILSMSLWGGLITSIMCMMFTDMKILIAYSSISHMSFVISSMMLNNWISIKSTMMMMFAHGVSSSMLFFGAFHMYTMTNTRLLMLNKGFISITPSLSFFWFMACMSNMAGPFTLNLLSEMMTILNIVNWNIILSIFMLITVFFSMAFNMILYTSTQHGKPNSSSLFMNNPTNHNYLLIYSSHLLLIILMPLVMNMLL